MSRSYLRKFRKQIKHITFLDKVFARTALLNIVIFCMILLTGFAYIAEINSVTAKGYQIRELEEQISELTVHNERMELEVATLQSMQNVNERIRMLGMVPSGGVDYLVPGRPAIAVNK